jgi:hypothetical protein
MQRTRGLPFRCVVAMTLLASVLLAPPARAATAPLDGVLAFGAPALGSAASANLDAPLVAIGSSGGGGYWEVTSTGQVTPFGAAEFSGTTAGRPLAAPVVGIAADPDGSGYWLAARDGGVFAFAARFAGSAGGLRLAAPIRAIAADPAGGGYWLVADDGGVFAFGRARFLGSAVGHRPGAHFVGIAATPSGKGYWLAASDGEVVGFGDAAGRGSARVVGLAAPVVGIAADVAGDGYWLAAADGGVFATRAEYRGSAATFALGDRPVIGIAADPLSGGYWLARATPAAPPASCGVGAFPVAQVRPGMTGSGLTVSSGTTIEPFSVTVIGTLPDAILPGVDMIVVRADSAAIRAAGGIWAGMSGSPVYAADGRLLGAVAYGTSWAPSSIVGLTPAEWMLGLAARALPKTATTARAAQATAAAVGDDGLTPLATPISVTAPRGHRFGTARELLTDAGVGPATYYRGAAAPLTASSAAPRPGSHVAVALAYGDVTVAATGTVTAVCGDTVLAFGHPITARGPITASAHSAEVVYVQPDPLGTPYAAARVGGTIGTVDQDRLSGVRMRLGAPPAGATVTMHLRDAATGAERAATTIINPLFPDASWEIANQLYGNLVAVQQQDGEGVVQMRWTATGTSALGPWELGRRDRYASQWYVAGDAAYDVAAAIDQVIGANPFAKATLTSLELVAVTSPDYASDRITSVSADTGAGFARLDPAEGLVVDPGTDVPLRIEIQPFGGGPPLAVDVSLTIAPEAAGMSGGLTIAGGRSFMPEPTHEPTSFDDVLTSIRSMPTNDTLSVTTGFGVEGVDQDVTVLLDEVVTGAISMPIFVNGGVEGE